MKYKIYSNSEYYSMDTDYADSEEEADRICERAIEIMCELYEEEVIEKARNQFYQDVQSAIVIAECEDEDDEDDEEIFGEDEE